MATVMEPEIESRPAVALGKKAAPGGQRRIVFMVMGVALLALLGFGAKRWWFSRSHVSTDNAQVDGHIIPILPKVGGFVAEVRVQENQEVKAGDTLVVVDDRDFRARLAQTEADLAALLATVSSRTRVGQAEAAVAQAQANALKARADLARMEPLAAQNIVSQQQLDAARAQAALQLSYTRIITPSAGIVSKKAVELGQLVQAGQPLMTVVPLEDVWVTANLKETETADVTPGDSADITVDAYKGVHFRGHVESLSPATGAKFSLLPPDNATGNFTKVVQRIPVRIHLDGAVDVAHVLRPGMSVVATIKTH